MVALEGRSDLAFCLYSFDVSPMTAAHLKASAATKRPIPASKTVYGHMIVWVLQ